MKFWLSFWLCKVISTSAAQTSYLVTLAAQFEPMNSRKVVAGNWKMNTSLDDACSLLANIDDEEFPDDVRVIVAPPAPYLALMAQRRSDDLEIAAQNCHAEKSGAYTGEWSAAMLQSAEVAYCILGHSERRVQFGEDDALIAQKINACLQEGVKVIYCCGESLKEREAGVHAATVRGQVTEALSHLGSEAMEHVIVAYEPVWAIGTGLTASADQAQEMHAEIRSLLTELFGQETSARVSILYGGSVKPSNAAEIFSGADVDGGLIGGASLNAKDFLAIIRANG